MDVPKSSQTTKTTTNQIFRARENLLKRLWAAAFLLFFQTYMIAPLIPHLAAQFHVSRQTVGLMVPAYMIPYALATLIYGLLSDRIGRRTILFASVLAFALCSGLTATANSITSLIFWRVAAGLGSGGIIVMSLTVIADLFPFEQRGRAIGWLFGAIAGGLAFGSTFGGLLAPLIGWRGLFLLIAALGGLVGLLLLPSKRLLAAPQTSAQTIQDIADGYTQLLLSPRGFKTYAYILLNGTFHSGVFTWLGAYLVDRYQLTQVGTGLALLGYGVPGFLLGPLIGRFADQWGRQTLIPVGLAIGTISGSVLMPHVPLEVAIVAITMLSLGFDMTHPLLAGIATTLAPHRRGQAMGLNSCAVFLGFGLGSLLFGWGMQWNFATTIGAFIAVEGTAAVVAVVLFRAEITT